MLSKCAPFIIFFPRVERLSFKSFANTPSTRWLCRWGHEATTTRTSHSHEGFEICSTKGDEWRAEESCSAPDATGRHVEVSFSLAPWISPSPSSGFYSPLYASTGLEKLGHPENNDGSHAHRTRASMISEGPFFVETKRPWFSALFVDSK